MGKEGLFILMIWNKLVELVVFHLKHTHTHENQYNCQKFNSPAGMFAFGNGKLIYVT